MRREDSQRAERLLGKGGHQQQTGSSKSNSPCSVRSVPDCQCQSRQNVWRVVCLRVCWVCEWVELEQAQSAGLPASSIQHPASSIQHPSTINQEGFFFLVVRQINATLNATIQNPPLASPWPSGFDKCSSCWLPDLQAISGKSLPSQAPSNVLSSLRPALLAAGAVTRQRGSQQIWKRALVNYHLSEDITPITTVATTDQCEPMEGLFSHTTDVAHFSQSFISSEPANHFLPVRTGRVVNSYEARTSPRVLNRSSHSPRLRTPQSALLARPQPGDGVPMRGQQQTPESPSRHEMSFLPSTSRSSAWVPVQAMGRRHIERSLRNV